MRELRLLCSRAAFLAASCVFLVARAAAQTPTDPVSTAVQAMGGDRLTGIKTLTADLDYHWWELEGGYYPDLSQPPWPIETLTRQSRDLAGLRIRNERTRRLTQDQKFTEVITPDAGYVYGVDGTRMLRATEEGHTMSGVRLTAELREEERTWLIPEMARARDRVQILPDQTIDGKRLSVAAFTSPWGVFTVFFDQTTKLPARIRTRDFDAAEGDSDYDAVIDGWTDVGGARLPSHYTYRLNGRKTGDLAISSIMLNPPLTDAAFAMPSLARLTAEKPVEAARVPFLWIIGVMKNQFYRDTDAMTYDTDGPGLQLIDLAPGVTQTVGGFWNTMVIATKDYLIAVDPVVGDLTSEWMIQQAKRKYPGKPFRYVIAMQFHYDHSGGVRAYAAEGATVVVGPGLKEHFERMLAAPHSLDYGLRSGARITPNVVEVKDVWTLQTPGREIRVFPVQARSQGMLLLHISDANLLWASDIAGGTTNGPAINATIDHVGIVAAVNKQQLHPIGIIGPHGLGLQIYDDLVAAVAKGQMDGGLPKEPAPAPPRAPQP